MGMKVTKRLFVTMLFVAVVLAGCGESGVGSKATESPESVIKRFYAYIAEGGPTAIGEAYKMVDERCRLSKERFESIVRNYPPDFNVNVVGSNIEDDHADVSIEYQMASMFGGTYTVKTAIPLRFDRKTNSWKVDFTGESLNNEKYTKKQ